MSQEHPELIFVSGPQAGQRVVLARATAVMGRGSSCDLLISEDFVSRSQARFQRGADGVALENLSSNGTFINGKRFKGGRQVLLDTGDLIGIGEQTQMLFVAAGDGPDSALDDYNREAAGAAAKDAFGKERQQFVPAQPPVVPAQPAVPAPEPQAEATVIIEDESKPKKVSEMNAGERQEADRRARRKKLTYGLTAYVGALLLVGLVLKVTMGPRVVRDPAVTVLTEDQIRQTLETRIDRQFSMMESRKYLDQALGLYQRTAGSDRAKYECVQTFKEAMACSGQFSLSNPEHNLKYREVLEKLIDVVQKKYRDGCLMEQKEDWAGAEDKFRQVQEIIDDPTSPLLKNVQQHFERVHRYRQLKEAKKKSFWGG